MQVKNFCHRGLQFQIFWYTKGISINLVLFDKKLLDRAEIEDTEIDLVEMFEEL